MTKILDRYASAVHSSNLKSKEATVYSDSDVLGAFGLAGKDEDKALAMALARLFSGDGTAAHALVRHMAEIVWLKQRAYRVTLKRTQATDMARAVLAWKRDGKCRACGGHGFKLIGSGLRKVKSHANCEACRGTTEVPFDAQFPPERRGLARWLLAEVEREQAKAGPAAMAMLAPRLDL